MKRIFLIMLTICMVMLVGCGGTSSSKNIDYLNLTLQDLKNINWDMTIDEFKEGIGDIEFEEEKETIRNDSYSVITIDDFSFGSFNDETIESYEFFKCYFKEEKLSEIAITIVPIDKQMDTVIMECENIWGKNDKQQLYDYFWTYENASIQLNTYCICTFVVTRK